MQNRMPMVSNLWPVTPRNWTWVRSGSFRLASPLGAASGGRAKAPAAPINVTATLAANVLTLLILRIAGRYIKLPPIESPLLLTLSEDETGFSDGISSGELPQGEPKVYLQEPLILSCARKWSRRAKTLCQGQLEMRRGSI